MQAAVAGRRRVEVFTLGTQLTRVTRELAGRDPDQALAQASQAVEDWSGGTRLGESLQTFNDEWGQRGMARGATVVILSDGWDRGEPAVMTEQMARLQRLAHEIIWVNPLKASPGYQPLAQGMAAAIPYVDRFIEGHCLDSLEVWQQCWPRRKTCRMKEILKDLDRWRKQGKPCAVARVVDLEGSGPRDPGAAMAVSEDGEVVGSVSGGCVEGAVVVEALEVIETGDRRMVTFGYSDDEAFAVGLTCGGTIHLYIEPFDW